MCPKLEIRACSIRYADSDQDQGVLREWLAAKEKSGDVDGSIWTLPPLPNEEADDVVTTDGEEMPEAERGGITDTKSFPGNTGLRAVPLLAALLSDDPLTLDAGSAQQRGFAFHGSRFQMGSEPDKTEKIRTAYQGLQKPRPRSALAWEAL